MARPSHLARPRPGGERPVAVEVATRLAALVGGARAGSRPIVVGIAGGVAAGKTTTADALARVLPGVSAVVATDGFLFPNARLDELGLGGRKGFPETYDLTALGAFLTASRAGASAVSVPVYSHERYDVLPGVTRTIMRPDVLVVEGLHALRPDHAGPYLDLGVYLDAPEPVLEAWFTERLHALCAQARHDPSSFYAPMAALAPGELDAFARSVWDVVNLPNLREHIRPTRAHADVVVELGPDHSVRAFTTPVRR